MSAEIRLSAEAEEDLLEIWAYVADHDSIERADDLLDNLEAICDSLPAAPRKGHVPKELRRIGLFEYLEIHCKPYRILYETNGKSVLIHAILDGRRDMETLLYRRLVR